MAAHSRLVRYGGDNVAIMAHGFEFLVELADVGGGESIVVLNISC